MNNAVWYKDRWLSKKSDAYELWLSKDYAKLDKHIAERDRVWKDYLKNK